MKKSILIILLAGFGFMAINCGNRANKEKNNAINSTNTEHVKLKWLAQWHGEGKKELLIHELAREFSLRNQNVDVEVEFPFQMAKIDPSINAFSYTVDTIIKMARRNEWPYDLMLCDETIYKYVGDSLKNPSWGKDYVVNFINEPWYISGHKDNFFKTNKYTKVYQGISPGAYIEGVWRLLYLSTEVENRLGIKVKRFDMNMSDYISYAKAVYDYNQSHTDKITFCIWPWTWDPVFNQLVMSALAKDSASTRDEAITAIKEVYKSLEKLSVYKPLEKYIDKQDAYTLYQSKALFTFHFSWIYLLWQNSNPEGVKFIHPCEMPSIDGKQATCYSGAYNSVFVVPKNAKNRSNAEKLVKFMTSNQTAEKWIRYSKSPTGLKTKTLFSDFGSDDYTKFGMHIKEKYHDNLDDINISLLLFHTNKVIDYQFLKVMGGEISADDAIKGLIKQLNGL